MRPNYRNYKLNLHTLLLSIDASREESHIAMLCGLKLGDSGFLRTSRKKTESPICKHFFG